MNPFITALLNLHIEPIIRTILLVSVGYLVARLMSISISKTFIKHLSPQQGMLLKRFIFYFIFALFLVAAVDQLGFHIGALLGAAGILTVAIGIASQTSMSNIISGLFMIGEKPFEVGHYIKIGETKGEVLSIDLLSVKLRTPQNTMVRIPNEMLIKSAITNLSFFPIRRADLLLGVGYKEDLEEVQAVLMSVADKNPLCLIEPKPVLQILNLGDSSINLQFSVWCSRNNYIDLTSTLQAQIKIAFAKAHIELPFPTQPLYSGSNSQPFPIKIVSS